MDALTDLLRGVHAQRAMMCRSFCSPPWALAFAPTAPLTLVTAVRGDTWLLTEDGTHVLMRPGDIGLIRGPLRFVLADDPATPPQVDFDEPDCEQWRVGTRTCGFPADGDALVISGSYEVDGSVSDRLLNALPPVLVVPCADGECPTVGVLSSEIAKDKPGQDIILARLLDLLLVFTLREWFDRPEANTPAWYRALGDEIVGPALRAMHDEPQRAWTVAELAARAGASRAALARRFTTLVGVPPLTYLTEWRMELAANLLTEPDATVGSVARAVGYADGFAFSTAFKRVRGVRPSDHRVVALRA
ncbi:AraC family transcriptional regulator [Saccharothrix sp. ALI-22-I]|uniref:AraC family transcriptional regulator n=1 Tax=Saccharothrix sp. ALI-22-I TaxID=1933778 RepID=UPI00097C9B55|nr:AraC family transcriptional regulator [Saccharothrix sp. ALI-22-I]ONI92389.1 AraC family transcriptional regulator [Saccharothrix sp. ALI-22-I]